MCSAVMGPGDQRRLRADGEVGWIDETIVDRPAVTDRPRRRGGAILGAAMIAVGEIIEPTKARVEIQVEIDADGDPVGDLPFVADFGPLPELS